MSESSSPDAAPLPQRRHHAAFTGGSLAITAVVVALVATTAAPPPYGLDAILLSYANNAADIRPLFYLSGWIQVLPQLTVYAARALPLAWQAALYPLVSLAVAVIMLREIQRLFSLWLRRWEAVAISFTVILYFNAFNPGLTQMIWSVWPLSVAAFCYILRKNLLGEPYSGFGFAAALAACLSNPVTIVLVPLLVFLALTENGGALRGQNAVFAGLLLAWYAAMFAFKPASIVYLADNPLRGAARILWHTVTRPFPNSIITAIALIALGWLAADAWRLKDKDARRRRLTSWLAYLGFSSLAVFLLSGRAFTVSTLPTRYTFVCVTAALIAAAARIVPASGRKSSLIVFAAVAITAIPFCKAVTNGLPLAAFETTRDRLRFLHAAGQFRAACRPGDALAPVGPREHLVVLCERTALARGRHRPDDLRYDRYGDALLKRVPARPWPSGAPTTAILLSPP